MKKVGTWLQVGALLGVILSSLVIGLLFDPQSLIPNGFNLIGSESEPQIPPMWDMIGDCILVSAPAIAALGSFLKGSWKLGLCLTALAIWWGVRLFML